MVWTSFFCRCAMLVSVLAGAVQADVAPQGSVDVPECMKPCQAAIPQTDACFESFGQNMITCDCRPVILGSAVQECFRKSCMPMTIYTTRNDIATSCNEPVRDRSKSYRNLAITLFILASLSVLARYATYISVGRSSVLDDVTMAVSFVLHVALFVCFLKMNPLGYGRDIWTLEHDKITKILMYFWITEYVYFALIGFVKTSFLLFYLQIFPLPSFRRVVWACITVNLLATFACCIAAIFVCSPISSAWTRWDGEHEAKCINNSNLVYTHAGMGIVMDLIALALPISQIWRLQMNIRKKIGVSLMFGVGAFVTIVSMLRLKSLVEIQNSQNLTWDWLEASLWSTIEVEVGLICACMPAIRLGIARIFPKTFGSSADSKQTGANRSHGNTLRSDWAASRIGVTTSVRVTHARRPQTNDQASFVQLVEIDTDRKSAASARSVENAK